MNNGKQMNNSKAPTFVDVEINEQEFVKQMRNDNTVRETKTVMNSFNKFVSQTLNFKTVLCTISKSFSSHCWELHGSIHKQLFGN